MQIDHLGLLGHLLMTEEIEGPMGPSVLRGLCPPLAPLGPLALGGASSKSHLWIFSFRFGVTREHVKLDLKQSKCVLIPTCFKIVGWENVHLN